ncbi:DUF1902 domain-containing protein [Candidatus Spongiihabitans sp.]|uniref:DUF1902 domain-containing protein n=1 Tax=Candidatus Spongiihabitans sp. TaxID=3101308 RepID=UPI003C7B05AB
MKQTTIAVHAVWDEDAHVWTATSTDLPRLVVEVASLDELDEEVKTLVPKLITLQKKPTAKEVLISMSHELVTSVPAMV